MTIQSCRLVWSKVEGKVSGLFRELRRSSVLHGKTCRSKGNIFWVGILMCKPSS